MTFVSAAIRRINQLFVPRGLVLAYHSISTDPEDPWSITVEQNAFEHQLHDLACRCEIVGLQELIAYYTKGSGRARLAALTFDDGYLDNYTVALPLLEAEGWPATFFVASNWGGEYWWDRLARIINGADALPSRITMTLAGQAIAIEVPDQGRLNRRARRQLSIRLWERLRHARTTEVTAALDQLAAEVGCGSAAPRRRALTQDEFKAMAQRPLVDVGGHTRSHPYLPSQDAQTVLDEISFNLNDLRSLTGQHVRWLAYPFGGFDHAVATIAQQCGVELAFTTKPLPVWHQTQTLQIPRYCMYNWSRNSFAIRLDKWLSVG
jgi:peptidoglycan/xylan/chitin deacetylase (PgdA/CDA1 family)